MKDMKDAMVGVALLAGVVFGNTLASEEDATADLDSALVRAQRLAQALKRARERRDFEAAKAAQRDLNKIFEALPKLASRLIATGR